MAVLILVAYIAGVVGWLWLVALAFNNDEMVWAILNFIFFPCAVVYGVMNFDEAKVPLLLVVFGIAAKISSAALITTAAS